MIDAPKVTIGMPVLDGAPTIERALDSLLRQTFEDFEIVISDNASTDGTDELLSRYSDDPRVRVVRQSETLAMIENFTFVLREARGTYFMWAACDDCWDETFLGALVPVLDADPSCGVAMPSVVVLDSSGARMRDVKYDGDNAPQTLSRGGLFRRVAGLSAGPPLHLFIYGLHRRTILASTLDRGFPPDIAGDRVLMCELALTAGFSSVPGELYHRTVYEETLDTRYPQDDLGATWRAGGRQRRYIVGLLKRTITSPLVAPGDKARIVVPTILRLAWSRRRQLAGELRRPGR